MAGMFYSLQEVAEKLNKSEDEVKNLVQQGRLREFRDGPNVLFKIDEVESLMFDTSVMEAKKPAEDTQQINEDEILLAPNEEEKKKEELNLDTAADTSFGLTDDDTAVANEGINVLDDMETGYQLSDDTLGETVASSDEASLEEIEEDVNLDTFGSGSGLLDLSLQADDTSLGGILDEIYTPEGEEGEGSPGAGMAVETEEMIPAETNQMIPEMVAPAVAQIYIEPSADTSSNTLGIMLAIPLVAVVYTAIVIVASFKGINASIMTQLQGIIWYVVGGLIGVSILISIIALMTGQSGGTRIKKPKTKKEKKPKQEKAKKEKKKK